MSAAAAWLSDREHAEAALTAARMLVRGLARTYRRALLPERAAQCEEALALLDQAEGLVGAPTEVGE